MRSCVRDFFNHSVEDDDTSQHSRARSPLASQSSGTLAVCDPHHVRAIHIAREVTGWNLGAGRRCVCGRQLSAELAPAREQDEGTQRHVT